jgi:hypothetical protein
MYTNSNTNSSTDTGFWCGNTPYIPYCSEDAEAKQRELERFKARCRRWQYRDEHHALRAMPRTVAEPVRPTRAEPPTPTPRACPVRHKSRQYWRRGYR